MKLQNHYRMERVTGIEPVSIPWEGIILPMNYTRAINFLSYIVTKQVV